MKGHSTLLPAIRMSSQHVLPDVLPPNPKGGNTLFHYCLLVMMSTEYSEFFTFVLHCKH